MSNYSILILDDDRDQLDKIKAMLTEGVESMRQLLGLLPEDTYLIDTETDAGRVAEAIRNYTGFPYNIILADIFMPLNPSGPPDPQGGAKRIYQAIKATASYDEIILVIMTNRESEATYFFKEIWQEQARLEFPWAVEYVKPKTLAGPAGAERLLDVHLWTYAVCRAIVRSQDRDWRKSFLRETVYDIFGLDPALMKAKLKAEQYANQKVISLVGESGTGKELIAQRIHANSERKDKAFLPINCNKAENLLDSEIFGHEKGAFTGADTRKLSVFERSGNGTVFLDEFGANRDIVRRLDEKLRRVLRSGEYERVGGTEKKLFTGTIILGGSALASLAVPADISQDLHERIKTYTIELPPLRDRRSDIANLANRFLDRYSHGDIVKSLAPEAVTILENYDWPGNVGELEKTMKLCAETLMSRIIDADDMLRVLGISEQRLAHKSSASEVITCNDLLKVMNDPLVQGNITRAAKLLYPKYSEKQIRTWKRQDVSKLIRSCAAADPDFRSGLPASYHPRGGRPSKRSPAVE